MTKISGKDIVNRCDAAFSSPERVNNDNTWRELSEFMLNNQHALFNTTNHSYSADLSGAVSTGPGAKLTKRIFDSTALQAVQDLASAFQGTVTNPATTWSKLRYQSDKLNDNPEAVAWLEQANDAIHHALSESNFDTEIAKSYQSFCALANMALFLEDRENDKGVFEGFRFTSLHLGQLAWEENKDGIVDVVYRKFSMTARQAVEKWGEKVSLAIKKIVASEPSKTFDFLQYIAPRDPKQVKLNEVGLAAPEKRPFLSLYIDLSNNAVVEEGGYYEFPVFVARWGLMPTEKYGRGPGHLAIPDTRTLNRLKMRALEQIDLQVRPPIIANQRDVFGQLDMRPGQISIVKNIDGVREFVPASNTAVLQFEVDQLKQSIRSIFFLDKLLLPNRTDTGEMTAFEVSQRIEQMQRVLGPTLSRLNSELLQPLIVRCFRMLLRAKALPELPNVLRQEGVNISIVFVNQLARAQQMEDVTSIQQWVNTLTFLAQVAPQVIDNIDVDGIARHTAKILGVPEEAVMDSKTIQQIREQRAQAQQQAQQLDNATKAADIQAKTGGSNGQQ